MKSTKNKALHSNRPIAILLALIAVGMSLLGSFSLDFLPWVLRLAGSIAIGAAVYALMVAAEEQNEESGLNAWLAKSLSALIIIALVTCAVTAIKSLSYIPMVDIFGRQFVYENLATGSGFAAIVLIFILSALQKDIYWITRKRSVNFDERQMHERRQIFETSYRIGAFLVLGAACFFTKTIHNIPQIIAGNFYTVPSHIYWLPFVVALTLFALPLILAAWKRGR